MKKAEAQEAFMKRALALARRGVGQVSPNPLVGAVVVKNGRIVGEGYYLFKKKDHAEVVALRQAGSRASGATLYVNLEPCAHHGRTPPCVDQILEAGIRRVFLAARDLNPLVDGRGVEALRKGGMLIHEGLCQKKAVQLNEKFFHFIQTRRPFVLLKLALSLDGKIAMRSGESQWITGEKARALAHRLRYEYDAILAGVNTVLQDNPSLDVRWRRRNSVAKVILDSRLRTPPHARVFLSGDPVIIFHGEVESKRRRQRLSEKATLIRVSDQAGLLDWDEVLGELGRREITSLILEGGARVAASALKAGLVHKVNFFYGPRIIGSSGLPGIGDLRVEELGQAVALDNLRVRPLPPDFVVEAYLKSGGRL